MLAQSSDWTFIMATGTTTEYATRRFNEHIIRFNGLCDALRAGEVSEEYLSELEAMDNIFPHLDHTIYASS